MRVPEHGGSSVSHDALPAEFAFIRRHFRRLAGEGALGLADDSAIFTPPAGMQLAVAADAMVEGIHFFADDPADTIGQKLLRCNLSDLAAMDASPCGYLLTVSKPAGLSDDWFAGFCDGLESDQREFGVTLLGGDTTRTSGPLTLSLTIIGAVRPGKALMRNGARNGHGLWVTGTIGDGALGLQARLGRLDDPCGYLVDRYRVPRPRIGLALGDIASACMDVSDGLVQDVGHLARESGVGADIELARIPLSEQARTAGPQWLSTCVTGGDDYELLLAVAPERERALENACAAGGVPVTRIGTFTAHSGRVRLLDGDGSERLLSEKGWSHF